MTPATPGQVKGVQVLRIHVYGGKLSGSACLARVLDCNDCAQIQSMHILTAHTHGSHKNEWTCVASGCTFHAVDVQAHAQPTDRVHRRGKDVDEWRWVGYVGQIDADWQMCKICRKLILVRCRSRLIPSITAILAGCSRITSQVPFAVFYLLLAVCCRLDWTRSTA
jgi:hypothetical protein